MANDLPGFAARLEKAAAGLSGAPMAATMKVLAEGAKADIKQALAAATGGDGRLSNWRGASPGADVQVLSPTSIRLYPKGAGAVTVLESGARAHTIKPRHTSARGRPATLSTPYGPRPIVRVPHTRGKHAWTKGRTLVARNTGKRAQKEISAQLRGALGG